MERKSLRERQAAALRRLDEGHQALRQSLEGLEPEEAFLGSRWSVREVLLHLDSENFVDALERIAAGEDEMLPPFSTREEQLAKELAHLEDTHRRFRILLAALTPEQLRRPGTPPNPANSYPALSMMELVERVAGHEAAHARQVEETRRFLAAFGARQRAVNIIGLPSGGDGSLPEGDGAAEGGVGLAGLSAAAKDLLNMADYVVGEPAALALAAPLARGVLLELTPDNREELAARVGRETRAGLWAVVCTLGDPASDNAPLVEMLRRHADAVTLHPPGPGGGGAAG